MLTAGRERRDPGPAATVDATAAGQEGHPIAETERTACGGSERPCMRPPTETGEPGEA